jgi:hypothetical protein
MTTSSHNLLSAFDTLPPAEQHEVALEILRRSASFDELTGEAFDELAAEVFRSYDDEESSRAKP